MNFGLLSQHSRPLAAWLEPAVPIGLGPHCSRSDHWISFLPPCPHPGLFLQDLGFSLPDLLVVFVSKNLILLNCSLKLNFYGAHT